MGDRVFTRQKRCFNSKLTELVDFLEYDDEFELYSFETMEVGKKDLGFSFVCQPLLGHSLEGEKIFSELYSFPSLPVGATVSTLQISMPQVDDIVSAWATARAKTGKKEFLSMASMREEMFKTAAFDKHGLIDAFEYRPKNITILMTVRIPTKLGACRSELYGFPMRDGEDVPRSKKEQRIMEQVASLKKSVLGKLTLANLYPQNVPPSLLLSIASTLLHPSYKTPVRAYHGNMPLKDQLFDVDDQLLIDPEHKDCLITGHENSKEKQMRIMTLSVKKYPEHSDVTKMASLTGDHFSNEKNIMHPHVISTHVEVLDQPKVKSRVASKHMIVANQAMGKAADFIKVLGRKKDEGEFIEREVNHVGKKFCRCATFVTVYAETESDLSFIEAKIKGLWDGYNFELAREREVLLNCFVATLPFQFTPVVNNFLGRAMTVFTVNASNFTPMHGDWKGNSRSGRGLLLGSRRGQLSIVDVFETSGNYSYTVTATMGSGKSVLAQEQVCSVVADGGEAVVFEVGGSFQRTFRALGGEYLYVDPSKKMCFNPFTNSVLDDKGKLSNNTPVIDDETGEAVYHEDGAIKTENTGEKDLVLNMLAMMAKTRRDLTDTEMGLMEMALDTATMDYGQEADAEKVAMVLDKMAQQHPECRGISAGMYKFTKGRYRDFMIGEANVDMTGQRLIGVEMQELSSTPEVRLIVLAAMLTQAENQMYKTDRSIPKALIVDEAHEFLGVSSADTTSAGVVFEKLTRKARKHGGSTSFYSQSFEDWGASNAARTIFDVSEWAFFLGVGADAVQSAIKSGILSMPNDFDRKMLESTHTLKGQYSEVMIKQKSTGMCEVGRLILDPYTLALATSDGKEGAIIDHFMKSGMTQDQALKAFATQQWPEKCNRLRMM